LFDKKRCMTSASLINNVSDLNNLPNICSTEPNIEPKEIKVRKINFNNLKNMDFKSQLKKITNYEENKIKAKYEQDMHSPDRTKFLFDYFKKIKI